MTVGRPQAARIYPQHSDAYLNWGIALSNTQQPEASLKMLHFALALDPKAWFLTVIWLSTLSLYGTAGGRRLRADGNYLLQP